MEKVRILGEEEITQLVPPHLRRYTVEFITNRAMSHELVRHRASASFSQESQRYVRYNDIQFIEPVGFDNWSDRMRTSVVGHLGLTESEYQYMVASNLKPQQARNILPNATATRIIMTADRWQWEHIFKLRCGGGADPQMIALMTPVRDEMIALWDKEQPKDIN